MIDADLELAVDIAAVLHELDDRLGDLKYSGLHKALNRYLCKNIVYNHSFDYKKFANYIINSYNRIYLNDKVLNVQIREFCKELNEIVLDVIAEFLINENYGKFDWGHHLIRFAYIDIQNQRKIRSFAKRCLSISDIC